MHDDRLERALRQRPPDEPSYVAGSYRRPRSRARSLAFTIPAIGAALILGLAIGSGLLATREQVASPPDPSGIADALSEATWVSAELTPDAWRDSLIDRGFSDADLDAFLDHDPFDSTVRYHLVFSNGNLTVQASYDDASPIRLGGGTWKILDDGTLRYQEILGGSPASEACIVESRVELANGSLTFGVDSMTGCDVDERLANLAFFDLVPFARETP